MKALTLHSSASYYSKPRFQEQISSDFFLTLILLPLANLDNENVYLIATDIKLIVLFEDTDKLCFKI